MEFEAERTGTGTAEWSEHRENVCKGCANDCLYCYAAANAAYRFKYRERSEWSREELTVRAGLASYQKKSGVVMFPTAHDITPFNLEAYVRVARLILEAGNLLLIVSKPRWECIEYVLDELAAWRKQVLLRFTIGTTISMISRFWEPGAPLPPERLDCLRTAFGQGWLTSVSIEPMLGGVEETMAVFHVAEQYVNDTIWIGRMNSPTARVRPTTELQRQAVEMIYRQQSDGEIRRLVEMLGYHPKVRWKDSIKKVIERGAANDQRN